jgi:hypothetical protein
VFLAGTGAAAGSAEDCGSVIGAHFARRGRMRSAGGSHTVLPSRSISS